MSKRTFGEKSFNIFNIILLSFVLIVTIYPFYYIFIASISEGSQVVGGNVVFYPIDITFAAYKLIPTIKNFFTSFGNTLFYTFFGALTSMAVMTMGAYALSRKRLKGRRFIGMMISFTMWFNAGIIPFYLNMDSLHLTNSRAGIIFGFACSAFYIIILRSYFEGIPIELEEAAKVDGMSNFGILLKIMLPLSTPVLATIGLYCVVDRWNGYFWAMILLKDINLIPLQVLLKKLIVEKDVLASMDSGGSSFAYTQETLIDAIIVVSIVPILAIYPFAQKYFVKGLTVGSVKG
ncbi:MAG: carbohydrate ABC transporter permease [Clostridiales bacterium]|nr:carbohydrate ABC transporter permease [Clostridiales bacterium]HBM79794.1 carbohydrate ABC transporter permease [Clostridiaceae bacterium]